MLTKRQLQILEFIYERNKTGLGPSYDEMMEHLGLQSKSGVHRIVKALEERGFIARHPFRARSITVLRLPGGERTPESLMGENETLRRSLAEAVNKLAAYEPEPKPWTNHFLRTLHGSA